MPSPANPSQSQRPPQIIRPAGRSWAACGDPARIERRILLGDPMEPADGQNGPG